jgi:hypothetical protein
MSSVFPFETSGNRVKAVIPGTIKSPKNLDKVIRSKHYISQFDIELNHDIWINNIYRLIENGLVFFRALNLVVEREEELPPSLKERQEWELKRQTGSTELWKKINTIKKTNAKLVWHCCYRDNIIQSFEKKKDAQSYANTSHLMLTVIGTM